MAKSYCHICGTTIKEPVPNCPTCGADLQNPIEMLISSSSAVFSKGVLSNPQGTLVLTNMRLMFLKEAGGVGAGRVVGGLIGAAISAAANNVGTAEIIIPLEQITAVDGKKSMMSGFVSVTSANGDTCRFTLRDGEIFKNAIQQAMAARGGQA